ncbi:hypothetical protein [Nocardioides sp. B-3]|uniref:hypothetical protein n=1 Tax=Nocardioides sp. B-3 TaxID=2895565 RepID=UPI00215241B7|nr:hypothetical protein [Nocardioides sp. B-3]UUZ59071.1 hypothetical protein LP418_24420 [Nocardioides sp. B-3]
MPKHVASTTLSDPEWHNTHVIEDELVTAVKELKEKSQGDIVQFGILGRSGPQALLFSEGPVTRFQLTEATPLASGIVILDYRVVGADTDVQS